MSEELPEILWISLSETVAKCQPEGYWKGGRWPAVFKQRRDGSIKYIRADSHEELFQMSLNQALSINLLQQQLDSALQTCDALNKRLQGLAVKYNIDGRTTGLAVDIKGVLNNGCE